MLVAVDLDEVLGCLHNYIFKEYNKENNTNYSVLQFYTYRWWETLGITRSDAVNYCIKLIKEDRYPGIIPLSGAIEGINTLSKKHKLIIVTSRQIELEDITKKWVDKYFKSKFENVYVLNHADWALGGKSITKKEICENLGVDILIEDNLDYAKECVSRKTKVLLIDYPWNKEKLRKDIYRVKSWKEIINHPLFKKG